MDERSSGAGRPGTSGRGVAAGFRDHLIPRSRIGRRLALLFVGLFLLAEWPVLPLVNRVEPAVLGFPFLFVWLSGVYVALIVVLLVAARRDL